MVIVAAFGICVVLIGIEPMGISCQNVNWFGGIRVVGQAHVMSPSYFICYFLKMERQITPCMTRKQAS